MHRDKLTDLISRARVAETPEQLLALQDEVDAMLRETLAAYDDGAIEEGDLSTFNLALGQFHHAVAERRMGTNASTPEPAARLRAR